MVRSTGTAATALAAATKRLIGLLRTGAVPSLRRNVAGEWMSCEPDVISAGCVLGTGIRRNSSPAFRRVRLFGGLTLPAVFHASEAPHAGCGTVSGVRVNERDRTTIRRPQV
jgi:hypothetical protein